MENSTAELSCSLAGSFFRSETKALRPCLINGAWGAPDLTTCTLRQDAESFLLIWFVLEINFDNRSMLLEPGGTSEDPPTNEIPSDSRLESEVCIERREWSHHGQFILHSIMHQLNSPITVCYQYSHDCLVIILFSHSCVQN